MFRRFVPLLLVALSPLLAPRLLAAAQSPDAEIGPFLEEHCFRCHVLAPGR